MSTVKLNRFIGNVIISDRTREWAISNRLNDVLRENELEEDEIIEIIAARPQSLLELCAVVERMVTAQEIATKGEASLLQKNLLLDLHVVDSAVT